MLWSVVKIAVNVSRNGFESRHRSPSTGHAPHCAAYLTSHVRVTSTRTPARRHALVEYSRFTVHPTSRAFTSTYALRPPPPSLTLTNPLTQWRRGLFRSTAHLTRRRSPISTPRCEQPPPALHPPPPPPAAMGEHHPMRSSRCGSRASASAACARRWLGRSRCRWRCRWGRSVGRLWRILPVRSIRESGIGSQCLPREVRREGHDQGR